jgi:hypothetical protein
VDPSLSCDGTFAGNDDEAAVEAEAGVDLTEITKSDDTTPLFDFLADEDKSGSFSFSDEVFSLYGTIIATIKFSNSWNWYELDPAACAEGTCTYDFGGFTNALSHATLWGYGEPERDVPEPGTLALLGLGLAGLGFGARRRKS